MELLLEETDECKKNGSAIEINKSEDFINQENDIHISVIRPITKRVIHCHENSKINAYYKPVELVEEVNTYVKKGDEHIIKMYENLKKAETKHKETKDNNYTILKKLKFPKFSSSNNNSSEKSTNPYDTEFKLFKNEDKIVPKIETVFIPKLEKNIEVVSCLKENVNVDYTYLVPKPVVIPVEVPILKFRDNFKVVPIRKKIIPLIKYTDDVVYVDCCVEKPYLVFEDIILPVPFDVPIEEKKYIHKAPPIDL
ncbi:inner membrane complex protein 1d, putative (IMC1d) [Plasmodium ovale wallikeri]|uniref:Inner membrane complex protein 1d, putative n=2 Tax=Plasmodium ovale TaxID=36330 RepID=A0A1C3KMC7_PLAOA|nr:inner membrane complex protein 1d, putative (IMC1d) [Plasmodium ovale wallikeri]SBT30812.1 inner membrane complex protein 1d, putative (IMC1d) [Plasmodium ovale wallikeri]SBT75153.1 inner membrane complex protein 1d, putative [Plasmodium ovale]